MQGPDKTMLDVPDKIAAFNEKLSLWKGDIASGVSRGKGGTIALAPNHCGGRRMTTRSAEKSQHCHNYFLQFSTFAMQYVQFKLREVRIRYKEFAVLQSTTLTFL